MFEEMEIEEVIDWPMSVTWEEPTDIIITDPCYLNEGTPEWEDVWDRIYTCIPKVKRKLDYYPGLREAIEKLFARSLESDYDDPTVARDLAIQLNTVASLACPLTKTDPVYWAPHPQDMFAPVGVDRCLCGGTVFGDWSCDVIDDHTGRRLGSFAADSGMYIVCAYDESKEKHRWLRHDRPDLATVIHAFSGRVTAEVQCRLWEYNDEWHEDKAVSLVGRGSRCFHTYMV